MTKNSLSDYIRTIPDYPKKGIMFRDVTTLFSSADGLKAMVDEMEKIVIEKKLKVDYVAGLEARGFIVGAALATRLNRGFIPLRKKGKLPYKKISVDYALEYGSDTIEMHVDAFPKNSHVLLVDDLIATGGTASAGISLIRQLEGIVTSTLFIVDLVDLGGADKIRSLGVTPHSLLSYSGE